MKHITLAQITGRFDEKDRKPITQMISLYLSGNFWISSIGDEDRSQLGDMKDANSKITFSCGESIYVLEDVHTINDLLKS
ncbi:MAG: hypothetical protein U9N49_08275 [Campylobacterota bacterium]|nr:hypothetical protein [Campylobacterota bacterium]